MQIFITIVVFLVIFSALILIHEFGHFTAAKRAGVKVEEFGMGLPPRIWGVKKGETLYSINWIPFGGFVRMLGEDGESKKNQNSFASKSPAVQLWIVSAGVVMNLLLSFVLLTIGFWIGIDPLMVDQEDFYNGIRNEQVIVEPGLIVLDTGESAFAVGDRIISVEGELIDDYEDWEKVLLEVEDASVLVTIDYADGTSGEEYLNSELLAQLSFTAINVPRLTYMEDESSVFSNLLLDGDVIIRVNGWEVINEQDLYSALSKSASIELEIYRPEVGPISFSDVAMPTYHPLVTYVMQDSPAAAAGLQEGDEIIAIGGTNITAGHMVSTANVETKNEANMVDYSILRDGNIMQFTIELDENDYVGVALSDRVDYYNNLSLYQGYLSHSLIEVVPDQYGLLEAPFVSVTEMWRLGKITAIMFLDVFRGFLGAESVPEGVAGPVGIAQMTFTAVQDGFSSVLRFVALLSLSLGVVNILPIPALDGGRVVFILYRGFTGHKPNPRIENFIHMTGFFLLLLFIAYITFNDVLNLF